MAYRSVPSHCQRVPRLPSGLYPPDAPRPVSAAKRKNRNCRGAAAGFPRPILHGLCTYGMTCKAMVDALLDGDTARVGGYGARFAGVVFPGETLKASIWKKGDGFQAVVTAPERDDAVALAGVELIPA